MSNFSPYSPRSPFAPATPIRQTPVWWRVAGFLGASALALAVYFAWRPPAPMLWLHHVEHMQGPTNEVALTFDDAPHPLTTPLLLASLQHNKVHGTFFSVGGNLRLYPELSHRIVSEGNSLANHSEPHHNLTDIPVSDYPNHVDAGFASIEKVEAEVGKKSETRLFRPPGGGLNRELMEYLFRRNYTLAWWSNNVGDWTCPPAWKIAGGVNADLKAGDVVLLHDGGTGTPQALTSIVKNARRKGLKFVPMPQSP